MRATQVLKRLLSDQTAATAVEYGLILALIVLVIIASITVVATQITLMWNEVSTTIEEFI